MKKILVIFLATVLALTFTACGDSTSDSDIKGSLKVEEQDKENQNDDKNEEKDLSLGHAEGNIYENEFIGIGFNLPNGWTFYTDEQIKALNNITTDMMDEEYAQAIENATILYDMYALDTLGNSVNINIEKLNVASALAYTEEEHVKATVGSVKDALSSMGLGEVTAKPTTVTIAGEKHHGIEVVCVGEQVTLYEKVICVKIGRYMANITIATVGSDTTSEIIEQFYALD